MSNKNIYLKYGKVLIKEGAQEENPSAFVIEDGSMSVHKDGNHICDLSKGSIVGEIDAELTTVKDNLEEFYKYLNNK